MRIVWKDVDNKLASKLEVRLLEMFFEQEDEEPISIGTAWTMNGVNHVVMAFLYQALGTPHFSDLLSSAAVLIPTLAMQGVLPRDMEPIMAKICSWLVRPKVSYRVVERACGGGFVIVNEFEAQVSRPFMSFEDFLDDIADRTGDESGKLDAKVAVELLRQCVELTQARAKK